MKVNGRDLVFAAVLIPVLSLSAVVAARRIGAWIIHALQASFGQVVVDVMAPDMAHLATKVTRAVDELNAVNAAEHAKVQGQLGAAVGRLSDVEARLAIVESKLGIRSPDARTRATDREDD